MNMIIEIMGLSTDRIDYSTIIFKSSVASKVDVDNSKDLWFYLNTIITGGALKIFLDMKLLDSIERHCRDPASSSMRRK